VHTLSNNMLAVKNKDFLTALRGENRPLMQNGELSGGQDFERHHRNSYTPQGPSSLHRTYSTSATLCRPATPHRHIVTLMLKTGRFQISTSQYCLFVRCTDAGHVYPTSTSIRRPPGSCRIKKAFKLRLACRACVLLQKDRIGCLDRVLSCNGKENQPPCLLERNWNRAIHSFVADIVWHIISYFKGSTISDISCGVRPSSFPVNCLAFQTRAFCTTTPLDTRLEKARARNLPITCSHAGRLSG
jgi:hypothetical protein